MSEPNDLPGSPEPSTPPEPQETAAEVPDPVTAPPVPEADATGEPAEEGPAVEAGEPAPEGAEVAEVAEVAEGTEGGEAADAQRKVKRRPKDAAIARAFRLGLPVEGRVEQVIKGGYEVRVGRSRGFCPHSQIELHRVENPEEHVGKTYAFRILQMRRGGEDLVLSRRALLEAEKAEEAKAVRATLLEGTVMLGRVAGMADFGAFVDLGAGVMGLVHLSELSHARVARVADAVHVGERVRVKILKLDESTGRISLSIRQAEEDPWVRLAEAYPVGSVHHGKVLRVTSFGAFVELARGLEALAPSREFPPSVEGFEGAVPPGTERDWVVLSIEPERKRMSIAPAPEPGEAAVNVELGAKLTGKVQKAERFGVFVWLSPGKVGLVPAAMTGVPRGGDLGRKFSTGQDLEVEVAEVAEDGRIRLSLPGVEPAPAPAPRAAGPARGRSDRPRRDRDRDRDRVHADAPAPSSSGSFGTSLGDLLRAAMDKKD